MKNFRLFSLFSFLMTGVASAQISHECVIGSPFYGITSNVSGKIVNQVGPYADFSVPTKLNVRSEANAIASGEVTKLNASIGLDDGTITRLDSKNVTWSTQNQNVSIQNGFLTAKQVSKNTRVSIEATAEGYKAILFVRILKDQSNAQDAEDLVDTAKNALSDSIDLEQPGWKKSNWFGNYYDGGNNWIHHQHHGWMYSFSSRPDSAWLWSPSQKWIWTSPSVYPHMYRNKDGAWMYFIVQALPQKVYYNQSSKSLERGE